jgi:hypothetical protein
MVDHHHHHGHRLLTLVLLIVALASFVGCGANRGISTDPRTLFEAWDLIEDYAESESLLFVGYAAVLIDPEGRSDDYTLSAFAPDQDVLYVLQATPSRIRFYSLPASEGQLAVPLDEIRDSPALVQDALAERGVCRGDLSLGVNLPDDRADALCTQPRWAVKISPYVD